MSNFIQIPNSVTTLLTHRSKHAEAVAYAIIRNEIKDSTLKASIAQTELATLLGVNERTVNTYVAHLKEVNLFAKIEKKQGEAAHPYNVYAFPPLTNEYFLLLPSLLGDPTLSAKQKGILLFLKAHCQKGTNYLLYSGKTTELAQLLGIGKNQISRELETLRQAGAIRFIEKSIHIIHPAFPLFLDKKGNCGTNAIYQAIYDFCLSRDRVPPYKNVNKYHMDAALGMIVAQYGTPELVKEILEKRCTNLPQNPSINYFCQVLRNRIPTPPPIIIMH